MPKFKFPKISVSPHKGPRNAFDLSQRHLFTAPLGMLLPVLSLHAKPNDHFDIDANDFMRTMPMNSTAFVDCKGVYEFFFVPYSQLWHGFDQFITSMNDFGSGLLSKVYDGNFPSKVPIFSLKSVITSLDKSVYAADIHRMFSLLGYGNYWNSNDGKLIKDVLIPDVQVNAFPFAAYQKIYQDFYRNTQYEPYDVSFSLDTAFGGVLFSGDDSKRTDLFFRPRFRNYGMDYLTNIRPNALFSGKLPEDLRPNSFVDNSFSQFDSQGKVGAPVLGAAVSVSSIRAAFAYDKLLSIMGRAPKTYKDQMKAIYGVDVSTGRDGKCYFLGGFDSAFQFGDVDQTSQTTAQDTPYTNALGSSVSKAVASGHGHIKFDAREHGLIMCLYSVIPTNQYDDTRIDPFNVKQSRSDYYIPMYDHIGMQPLYTGFVNNLRTSSSPASVDWAVDSNKTMTTALGWQPRYSEYKTAIDINHGQFSKGGPLSYFTSSRARGVISGVVHDGQSLPLTSLGYGYLKNLTIKDFKISPNLFDSIFKVSYNGFETTDPFFGGCYFNVTKVSDMDVQSLPYA